MTGRVAMSQLRAVGYASGGRVAYVAIQFITHVVLARQLGVTRYGVFQVALTWTLVGAALGQFGLHRIPLRSFPLQGAEPEQQKDFASALGGFWGTAAGAVAMSAALVVLGRVLADGSADPGIAETAATLAWSIIPMNLAIYAASAGLALADPLPELGSVKVVQPTVFLIALWWSPGSEFFDLGNGYLQRAYVASWACALAGAVSLFMARHWVRFRGRFTWRLEGASLRAWIAPSLRVYAADIAYRLRLSMDLVVVGGVFVPSVAGAYALASRLAALLVLFKESANALATARFRAALHRADHDDVRLEFGRFARSTVLVTALAAGGLAGAAELALQVFGSEFTGARWILLLLTVGAVAGAAFGPSEYLLMGMQRERDLARGSFAAVVTLVAGCVVGALARSPLLVAAAALGATGVYGGVQFRALRDLLSFDDLRRRLALGMLLFVVPAAIGGLAERFLTATVTAALVGAVVLALLAWSISPRASVGTLWERAQ